MHRYFRSAVINAGVVALASTLLAGPASAGDGTVSLAHLAPELGYTYSWIASESAVALTRPGLYVLVRTGNPLYDVNDAVETTLPAPQYRDNDIYVGSALVARLRALAAKFAPRNRAVPDVSGASPGGPAGPAPHGALTIGAVPTNVSDAVVVSGTGPANVPLTIRLEADIARDIPRVLLSRTTTMTDAAGNFSIEIHTAPLHLQKSLVLISATSLPGVTDAHTSFVLGSPSPNIAHPIDETPRDFRPHR
jgi:hypothetical protein